MHDDQGRPVLGVTEHDPHHSAAMIYLNGDLMVEREDLIRSTALHELGHAIFDAPGWIAQVGGDLLEQKGSQRRYRIGELNHQDREVDWREWRANEFMGAFLAPRQLLHSHVVKRAAALGLPLVGGDRSNELPVLRSTGIRTDGGETLAMDLADLFGVSPSFIEVRLRKYRLIART